MIYFRIIRFLLIYGFFVIIAFNRSTETGMFSSAFSLWFSCVFAVLLLEFAYFKYKLKEGKYRRYEVEVTGSVQLQALILLLATVFFVVLLILNFHWNDLFLLMVVLLLFGTQFYLRYKYDGYLFANDQEMFKIPGGPYYRWRNKLKMKDDPEAAVLELRRTGLLGILGGKSAELVFTGESREAFLRDHRERIKNIAM